MSAILRPLLSMVRFFRRRRDQVAAALSAKTSIWNTNPRDVFITGYPKSGHTWVVNLVAGAAYGVDPARTPETVIQDLIPDVYHARVYRRFSTPMFFKSHELPQPHYQRVVYLLRDGRDAMVSYIHFTRALSDHDVDFADFVGRTSSWSEHVEAWLSNPYQAEIITVRYEDLLAHPARELARICEFAGIESDPDVLAHVAERAAFDNLRKKEASQGIPSEKWPREQFFHRRGIAGSYKDEMPPDVLELFMQRAQATLHKCGYTE